MKELKPCPFCGSDVTIYSIDPHPHVFIDFPSYYGGWFVECTNCSCCMASGSEEEARKSWNRRAEYDEWEEHDPSECRYAQYDICTETIRCMGTKERDQCEGRKCKLWAAKEETNGL